MLLIEIISSVFVGRWIEFTNLEGTQKYLNGLPLQVDALDIETHEVFEDDSPPIIDFHCRDKDGETRHVYNCLLDKTNIEFLRR